MSNLRRLSVDPRVFFCGAVRSGIGSVFTVSLYVKLSRCFSISCKNDRRCCYSILLAVKMISQVWFLKKIPKTKFYILNFV